MRGRRRSDLPLQGLHAEGTWRDHALDGHFWWGKSTHNLDLTKGQDRPFKVDITLNHTWTFPQDRSTVRFLAELAMLQP